jgi:pseudouridine kinase
MRRGRVLVAGGLNADLSMQAHSGAAAGSSTPATAALTPGGVARNVAEALARLGCPAAGCPVQLLAVVGDDPLGAAVLAQTRAAGVDTSGVLTRPGLSGLYLAALDLDGELLHGLAAMALCESLTPEDVAPWLARLPGAALLVLDANLPPAVLAALLAGARQHAVPALLDPVGVDKAARLRGLDLRGLWLLTPDAAEAQALGGPAAVLAAGAENVVVTHGAQGSVLHRPGQPPLHTPAAPAVVRDVTGAGDALLAGLCAATLRGYALPVAVQLGHRAAALAVASPGSCPAGLSWSALAPFTLPPPQESP